MRNILLVVTLIVAGCSTNDKPSDLPLLYHCTVTITQDGTPLAEASVEFVPIAPAEVKYRAASVTDADGRVSVTTYGFQGVPAGKYKVIVTKNVMDDLVYKDNPSIGQKEVVSFKTYQTVEPKYSSMESSPHEIEITGKEKKTEKSFDVGKAVKTKFNSSAM